MFRQLFYIISGFLIGQGSMFIAQSYLAVNGYFELIASIGIGLGLLSLMQWAADGGGVFLLSRLDDSIELNRKILSFIIARIIFSFIFYALIFIFIKLVSFNEVILDILVFLPLIAFVWVFNLTGLIDKFERNYIAGPLSGLSWLFSSLVLVIFLDDKSLGIYIGLSFFIGLIITVLIQYSCIRELIKIKLDFSVKDVASSLIDIMSYNLAYLSGQCYARCIPILVDNFVGTKVAGIYIYAKNISNTASQFVLFSRRVEFSNIMKLTSNPSFSHLDFVKAQSLSFYSTIFFALLSVVFYFLVNYFELVQFLILSELCFLLFFVLFFWLLASALGQVYVAQGRLIFYGLVLFLTSMLSILFIYLFIETYGIYTVIFSELCMLTLQIFIYYYFLRKVKFK